MKTFRTTSGPFFERPVFKLQEIEGTCSDSLKETGLYPAEPSPVKIDFFIEKRFGVPIEYEDLGEGILGYTRFGPKGVEAVVLSRALGEDEGKPAERRERTTLAHEAGHGLLHAHLFALETLPRSLFEEDADPLPRILCREGGVAGTPDRSGGGYDGRWWEFQANQAMGALLLPGKLVETCLGKILKPRGIFGLKGLPDDQRKEAALLLADTFEVNPVVARIRLEGLYPTDDTRQLTL